MRRFIAMLSLVPLALLSNAGTASEYVCTNGSLKRMISVQHEVEGQELPCAVKYEKPDEGGTVEFPWSASNTKGYCVDKAEQLATRLSSYGWSCDRVDGGMGEMDSMEGMPEKEDMGMKEDSEKTESGY